MEKKQEPEGKMASAETGTKLEFEQVEEQDMRQSNETGNGTNRGQQQEQEENNEEE